MPDWLWQLDEIDLDGRERPRLESISLSIAAGTTAVIGASGAGKTSLLNLLVGFERPSRGRLDRSPPDDPNRLPLFWVPPGGGLWTGLSVRDHLELVSATGAATGPVTRVLEMFELADLADASPERLSEGERSRLAVARAVAADAAVLVMDEPLVHVDAARSARLWHALRDLLNSRGTSLVFSTHAPQTVLREAEHVICLGDGRLLGSGPVEQLYDNAVTRELAECLGPVNWFKPDDAARWLGTTPDGETGIRPERLRLVPADDGPLEVVQTVSLGPIAETELRHVDSREQRSVLHAASDVPSPGDRVKLDPSAPQPGNK